MRIVRVGAEEGYSRIADLHRPEAVGREYRVRGWVYRHRVHGEKIFIVLRDPSGIIQCVLDCGRLPGEVCEKAEELGLESSIEVAGVVRREPRAPGGYELHVTGLRVYGLSRNFPIKGGEGVDYLLDHRHLWIRSRKLTAVMKIKHTVLAAAREFLAANDWWEVTPPILTAAAVEGGATLFPVKYFDKTAYLSQSAQLYLEALIYSLGKVWSLTTSFRAEKSRTRRHLAEYWHLELEAAWYTMEDMMRVAEEMIAYIVEAVLDRNREELRLLRRDPEKLRPALDTPYPRIRYDKAIEILREKGVDIEWGMDLGADEERVLAMEFDKPFYITHFPREIKAFYMKRSGDDPRTVKGFDMLAPEGYGEIIGGSEREESLELLLERIREEGYDPRNYEWYLDLRRYGSVPHSGFGLGVERLVMWIAGLDHIRDATPFPRFRGRIYP